MQPTEITEQVPNSDS
jgi:WD40 repeat protein